MPMTTAIGKETASNLTVGAIRRISIEFLDDGVVVECQRKTKPRKGNEPYDWDEGQTRKAFDDKDAAADYLRTLLTEAPKDRTPKSGKKA